MEDYIDFVGSAKWLIQRADEVAATSPTISIEHATGRMLAAKLLGVMAVNADMLAALKLILKGGSAADRQAGHDAAVAAVAKAEGGNR